MNSEMQKELAQATREAALYFVDFASRADSLWHLYERGSLFELFQKSETADALIQVFSSEVHKTIAIRKDLLAGKSTDLVVTGRYLSFNPSMTMYDGLSSEVTGGFFDSDDTPPPELWVAFQDERLISFIPEEFLEVSQAGVEHCMSGCLEWISPKFGVPEVSGITRKTP